MAKGWIAVDFDHCLWKNERNEPAEGFRDFLDEVHSLSWKVIVHSCNRPAFIRQMCELHDLRIDAIWGELPGQEGQKPVASAYVDDKGVQFRGDWASTTEEVLKFITPPDRR